MTGLRHGAIELSPLGDNVANEAQKYERASKFAKGIGESLDTIQNRDVLLRSYEVSERPMRGDTNTFVALKISELDQTDTIGDYHAWSESLATKLSEIPQSALPVVIKFERVNTSAGFRVWTFS